MSHPAWLLVLMGVILALAGVAWLAVPSLPWLGRLPGDIRLENNQGGFYFPITTCLLLSVVLSAIAWVVRMFWR
jgi:hypothetical protein